MEPMPLQIDVFMFSPCTAPAARKFQTSELLFSASAFPTLDVQTPDKSINAISPCTCLTRVSSQAIPLPPLSFVLTSLCWYLSCSCPPICPVYCTNGIWHAIHPQHPPWIHIGSGTTFSFIGRYSPPWLCSPP
jgi:hypothetical protein